MIGELKKFWNPEPFHITNRLEERVKIVRTIALHHTPVGAAHCLSVLAMLVLAGCSTAPKPIEVEPVAQVAPAPEPEPSPKPPPQPAPKPVVTSPPAPVQTPPPVETPRSAPVPVASDKLSIRIDSNPTGAMILVDGKPVGRAPVEVVVDTTENGFFKAPVTIRARFVAGETGGESFSIDERLGQLERVPQALVFSHDGAQRILRQL